MQHPPSALSPDCHHRPLRWAAPPPVPQQISHQPSSREPTARGSGAREALSWSPSPGTSHCTSLWACVPLTVPMRKRPYLRVAVAVNTGMPSAGEGDDDDQEQGLGWYMRDLQGWWTPEEEATLFPIPVRNGRLLQGASYFPPLTSMNPDIPW